MLHWAMETIFVKLAYLLSILFKSFLNKENILFKTICKISPTETDGKLSRISSILKLVHQFMIYLLHVEYLLNYIAKCWCLYL